MMDEEGRVIDETQDPKVGKEQTLRLYQTMLRLSAMDTVLYDAQRQGRISFYMTNYGEEATHVGTASAIKDDDVVYGQYREVGVLLYRGFTIDEFVNQCTSNQYDYGKGRQMPIHYGSDKLHFHTISSPLATQIPQAAGNAYAMRLQAEREGTPKRVSVCYFGDGAASEGDFHAALNFAAVLGSPTIFVCRNNGYAISTPTKDQYRGDGIAARGPAYGIHTIRVDGNDVWAVYNATKEAREIAVSKNAPVLIECMTYRVSHHSTSDDASRYRSTDELTHWTNDQSPIRRLRAYIVERGWWSEDEDKEFRDMARKDVLKALPAAEKHRKPAVEHLFTDVYDELTPELKRQRAELIAHLEKYPDEYNLDAFEGGFEALKDAAAKR